MHTGWFHSVFGEICVIRGFILTKSQQSLSLPHEN